jgi:hypothetical protein
VYYTSKHKKLKSCAKKSIGVNSARGEVVANKNRKYLTPSCHKKIFIINHVVGEATL